MKIIQSDFGKYKDQKITLYELTNNNGFVVKLMSLGATITQIKLPDETSISCGFDSLDEYFSKEYINNAPYFGATIGRYCSQIKDAKFKLNNTEYNLAKNCGENNLHGGICGFDKKIWDITPLKDSNTAGVKCSLKSKDMEEGFPGEVEAEVKIMLTSDNEIKISYKATTNKDTPLSMTNHSYFNLSGFKKSIEELEVQIPTTKLMEMDNTGAATGVILDTSGGVNDLTTPTKIKDIESKLGEGMEHFYIYENPNNRLNLTAIIKDKEYNRSLEVYSTEPCMLFYTAKHMSNKLQRNNKERYGKTMAFACETHRWQNGVNISNSPCSITKKDEIFNSETVFKFNF